MYDVDGNGVIDLQEMTKIVQVCIGFYFELNKVMIGFFCTRKCKNKEERKQSVKFRGSIHLLA